MEYLSDGISETLIFKLSQLPNLKVRSLSSVLRYKGTSPDLRKVGADLNVRAVLTGRVAVRNDRLAIVVELVDTRDNSTIWGNTYNRMLPAIIVFLHTTIFIVNSCSPMFSFFTMVMSAPLFLSIKQQKI